MADSEIAKTLEEIQKTCDLTQKQLDAMTEAIVIVEDDINTPYILTPKGIAHCAILESGLAKCELNSDKMNRFWELFVDGMKAWISY